MADVRAVPWNGYNVCSFFAGGGGSCLGYRMAGFKVVYANEFNPKAIETYKANHESHVDERDIREVTPEDVIEASGIPHGELDVLDGSPPCNSFSPLSHKEWVEREYSDSGKMQRTEDLFFEYIRILRGLMPRTFMAENVPFMAGGKSRCQFIRVVDELKDCGYRVRVFKPNAVNYGVPQARRRLFFVGVREDISAEYVPPKPSEPTTIRHIFPANTLSVYQRSMGEWYYRMKAKRCKCMDNLLDQAAPTIHTSTTLYVKQAGEPIRSWTPGEAKQICTFPVDFDFGKSMSNTVSRLGMAVPPKLTEAFARALIPVLDAAHLQ